MKVLPRLLAAFSLLSITSVLHAALIVDWGGTTYVTGNQAYSNPNVASPNTTQYGGFSSGNPLLLSPSSGYNGSGTAVSATFYGAVVRTEGTENLTTSGNGVFNNINGDRLEFKLNTGTISALVLWKQTDFLNGLNSGTLNMAAGSTLDLTLGTNANPTGTGGRAVVRSNGSYFISEIIVPNSILSLNKDLTTLNWFSYNPASSINTIGASYNLAGSGSISSVTEVGFYFDIKGSPNAIRISSVEFDYVAAVVVPEPSSFAVLMAAAAGALCLQRRKHRSV